jgi:hypothetical protein
LLQGIKKKAELLCDADELEIHSLKESFAVLLFHITQSQPNPFQHLSAQCLNLCLCLSLLQIVVCQSARDRMKSGLGKMKKHQSIVARPSPALGVLFSASFDHTCLLSLYLQPPISLSFQDRLLWFHDTINIGRALLSFLSNLL